MKKPDKNIDHRRVPNQMCFMGRFGIELPLDKDWQPGDFIFWDLGGGLVHCGVISDKKGTKGHFLVIHNNVGCDVNQWRHLGRKKT